MKIHFSKYHGLGNDYLFIDTLEYPQYKTLNFKSLAKDMSHRRLGPGADGIVIILPSENAVITMRIFNADGTEAENCGNALRCLARICREREYCLDDSFCIETKNRPVKVYLDKEDTEYKKVRVEIGKALFERSVLPMIGQGPCDSLSIVIPGTDMAVDAACVSVGNPHCILFWEDYTHADVIQFGPMFEKHPLFPENINVGFCMVENPGLIRLSVWERGSGFTGACGTGAAAAFAACRRRNLTADKCSVRMTGGALDFYQDNTGSIHMIGPATYVYDGACAGRQPR